MTEAFNTLYEELKARVVRETISELQRRWSDDDWRDTKSFTSDEVINTKASIERMRSLVNSPVISNIFSTKRHTIPSPRYKRP